jgi:hypothetical protein
MSMVVSLTTTHPLYILLTLSLSGDSLNLEGQVPVFIYPRNKVAQLYPQALGSLFVASYDSQRYGGVILTSLDIEFGLIVRSSLHFQRHIV